MTASVRASAFGYTGITPSRADDQIGLSFASANFGDPYRQCQALIGDTIGKREVVIEAAYSAVIAPWLSVQPDVQYVINPGGKTGLRDAVVIGLRIKLGR